MKTIIIGFSRNKNNAIGSELIQKFMGKPFSHTYFKFKEDLYKDYTIFHAIGKGLVYMSETTFLEHNLPIYQFEIQILDELFNELMEDCHINAGKHYGFMQNIGIAIVRSLKKININITKNPFNEGINCSEWMYYILEEIYGKWTPVDPNLIAPDEVCDFLLARGMKCL